MSKRKIHRDARTGEFVPKTTVETSPETTVTETVETPIQKQDVAKIILDEFVKAMETGFDSHEFADAAAAAVLEFLNK